MELSTQFSIPRMPLKQGRGSVFDTSSAVTAATRIFATSDLQPDAVGSRCSIGDLMGNEVQWFKIIDSTLREGEQFANSWFTTEKKSEIARALDDFGVDYIELTSPAASEQSLQDCRAICKLNLKAKVLTHIRCHMSDARIAVETGVDGVNIVMGTSSHLQKHSHGKDIAFIRKAAVEVIRFVKSKGLEVRFSSEDSFRSDLNDILSLYSAADSVGVHRVGIADTVGGASPLQVYDLVRTVRGAVKCDIETHFHNDTGSAVANAYTALEAGATHIDTTVLGIGERNGITSLGGLMARMTTSNAEYIRRRYKLEKLPEIEGMIAQTVKVDIPFDNCSVASLDASIIEEIDDSCLSEIKPRDSDSSVVIYPQDAAFAPGKKQLRLDILLDQGKGELLSDYRKKFRGRAEANSQETTT